MTLLKIAASPALARRLHTERALVPLDQTNFTDIAALVISVEDVRSSMLAMRRPMLRLLNWMPRRRVTNKRCCRRFLIR